MSPRDDRTKYLTIGNNYAKDAERARKQGKPELELKLLRKVAGMLQVVWELNQQLSE